MKYCIADRPRGSRRCRLARAPIATNIRVKPVLPVKTPSLGRVLWIGLIAGSALLSTASAQSEKKSAAPKPKPDLANVSYGPHARNVLDLWQAKSVTPTPLVAFIHGGGFRQGSKESVSAAL